MNEYKNKIREINKPLFNVLETTELQIDAKMNVHLLFVSNTMQAEFERERDEFVQAARQSMNNFGIRVLTDVSKDIKTRSHIKSRKDIYDDLVKKFPIVNEFTKNLGLDIENDPD